MQVHIVLEQPQNVYTNLDIIRGKIILRLPSSTNIISVVAKLQGESKTRLLTPANKDLNERPSAREETHKVLYKVLQVFPPGTVAPPLAYPQRYYTLGPGQCEYAFEFKFPFNNSCGDADAQSMSSSGIGLSNLTNLANMRLKALDGPVRHVKTTLPPTLTAFPGLAEIRYYLKVTVNRKEFYKENPRVIQHLNFFPIEPPRQPPSGAELYARRQHSFVSEAVSKPNFLLGNFHKKLANVQASTGEPPQFSVEVRLPSPPIITCNEDVPLRIIVKRLNQSTERLYFQSFQLQLMAHTRIKAHEIFRDEASSWIVVTHSDLRIMIKSLRDGGVGQMNEEIALETQPWRDRTLPSSVAPTFDSCNISRKYEMVVQVGIGWGSNYARNCVTIPLRHVVQVYSGIRPPAALLAAMSASVPPRKPVKSALTEAPPHLRQPQTEATPSGSTQNSAARPYVAPIVQDEEEPPPSYEDAIAQGLPPIDGQRRMYEPPPVKQGSGGFAMDRDDT